MRREASIHRGKSGEPVPVAVRVAALRERRQTAGRCVVCGERQAARSVRYCATHLKAERDRKREG